MARGKRGEPAAQVHMDDEVIRDKKLEEQMEKEWKAKVRRKKANTEVRELREAIDVALADHGVEEGTTYRVGRFPITVEEIPETKVEFTQNARTKFEHGDPVDGA